jgi:hypothetical protein
METINTSTSPVKKSRGTGRVLRSEELVEIRRMREGVIRYVKGQLAAGRDVCPILTKYVTSLEVKMKAQ